MKCLNQLRTFQFHGALEFCVLALLCKDSSYGFDLIRRLRLADGMVTSEGTIYPLLSRLRRTGLAETKWQVSESGPPRRYYMISDEGAGARGVPSAVDRIPRFCGRASPSDGVTR
jgi:PadR family transcriptional regulator PadR